MNALGVTRLLAIAFALASASMVGCSAASSAAPSPPYPLADGDDAGEGGQTSCSTAGCCFGDCDPSSPPDEPPPIDASASPPPESVPPGGSIGDLCVTSIDCFGGLVCGFDPDAGCNASGACVAQVAGPTGGPACGCDGLPVQYVTPAFTSVPVAGPVFPCGTDAGPDAGTDAGTDDASATD